MSDLVLSRSELTQVPSVMLTEKAFLGARNEGWTAIQPNPEVIHQIGAMCRIDEELMPDLTLIHQNTGPNPKNWDTYFANAAPDAKYFPASELKARERGIRFITKEDVEGLLVAAGKRLVQVTVKNWGQAASELGPSLVEGMTEFRRQEQAGSVGEVVSRITGPFGKIVGFLGASSLQTERQKNVQAARDLRPYTVS